MGDDTKKIRRKKNRKRRLIPSTAFEKAILYGTAALIPLLPLMLGTTTSRPLPLLIYKSIVMLLFGMLLANTWYNERKIRTTLFWLLLLAATGITVFQLIPLPSGLLALLSPASDAWRSRVLSGIGLYGSGQWAPISLDPAETWLGLSGFLSLLMIYLIAANVFSNERRTRRILQILSGTGFVLALIAFSQKAIGMSRILGTFPFPGEPPFFFSTFINPNHFAAYLALCVPLQITLGLKEDRRGAKLFLFVMAVVSALALFATLSRGGIVAFLSGQALLLFLLLRNRKKGRDLVWAPVAVVAVLVLASLMAFHNLADEYRFRKEAGESSLSRPDVWKDTVEMIADFPLLGVGAEGFKSVHPAYKTLPGDKRFLYPENIALQTFAESGLPAGALVLLAVAAGMFLSFQSKPLRRSEIGILAALFTVAIHNYIDFNLNTFAVSVPFFMLLGILNIRFCSKTGFAPLRARGLAFSPPLALFLAGGFLMLYGQFHWQFNRSSASSAQLHAVAYDRTVSDETFRKVLARELTRHPMDSYLRILASERYLNGDRGELPMKLLHLSKAERLDPENPRVDAMAGRARALVNDIPGAAEAYKHAIEKTQPDRSVEDLWTEMIRHGLGPENLAEATRTRPERMVPLARFLVGQGKLGEAERLLSRFSDQDVRQAPVVLFTLAEIALDNGDFAQAEESARKIIRNYPNQWEGYLITARIRFLQNEFQEALSLLKHAREKSAPAIETWSLQARVLLGLGRVQSARKVANRVYGVAWKHPSLRREAFLLSGDVSLAEEKRTEALRDYENARIYAPDNPEILFRLAECHRMMQNCTDAVSLYRRLADMPKWRESARAGIAACARPTQTETGTGTSP